MRSCTSENPAGTDLLLGIGDDRRYRVKISEAERRVFLEEDPGDQAM